MMLGLFWTAALVLLNGTSYALSNFQKPVSSPLFRKTFAAATTVTSLRASTNPNNNGSATPTRKKKTAVVVGAGPVGIATALTLANAPHYYDVTLLETSPQTAYDPTRAFLYNLNLRGQKFTEQYPSMQKKVEERGVKSTGFGGVSLTIVPADPKEPIPKQKASTKKDNENDEKKVEDTAEEMSKRVGYWIPRNEMVKLMLECVEEHEKHMLPGMGRIQYCPGTEFVTMKKEGNDSLLVTTKEVSSDKTQTQVATLVIGADGMNSRVRNFLVNEEEGATEFANWSNYNPKKFTVKKWTSPASHQRIKVLQLPPQFEIPDGEGGVLKTQSDQIYALRSIYKGPRNYLSLGLLPMTNNTAVRPTNIVTRPDHEIWGERYKTGDAVREWFEIAYPRFPFGKDGGMIDDAEWERFAKAEGTRFPSCQYSPGMGICNDDGTCGVCLVGDAIHAFPPDIGQGVNAGLADVVALDKALKGQDTVTGEPVAESDPTTLKANIERYQQQHEPEIAALIRLARFGAPFQYRQPHRVDRLRLKLWTLNVVVRMLLNKVTFGLVPNQAIILSQNQDLTFRQVMRKADITSTSMKTVLLGTFVWILKKRLGLFV